MPKFAGSHTISRFPSELDFGGPDGLFVALLKPFIDQFVTIDDREGMLLVAEAVNVLGSGYFRLDAVLGRNACAVVAGRVLRPHAALGLPAPCFPLCLGCT